MLALERAKPILGSTFIERMTGKQHAILRIGNELFTRHQLVTQVGTGNFLAARNLSKLVAKLNLATVRDLYRISPYELAGEHGIGTATLFVLMSIFENKGLDIRKWMGKEESLRTFDTLKHHAMKRDAAAVKSEKKAIEKANRRRGESRTREYLGKRKRTPKPSPEVLATSLMTP